MWLLTYPGDLILVAIARDIELGTFFEITPHEVVGTWLSIAFGSLLLWSAVLGIFTLMD